MHYRSKRYRAVAEQAGGPAAKTPRPLPEAVALLKTCATAKFKESVDLAIHLNIDQKKADQQVRGSFSMPHGTGRNVRVIVFVDDGEKMQACLAGGAVKAGGEDLVNEVNGGFMDFDVAIATPKMMRLVGRLGKVLGPRGLMPSPKSGSVVEDVAGALKEFRAGKIEYRADANGNLHIRVGTVELESDKLTDNIGALLKHIVEHRPSSVKGDYVKSVTISSTMGPGIRVLPA